MKKKIKIFSVSAVFMIALGSSFSTYAFGEKGCVYNPSNVKGDCAKTIEGVYKCQVSTSPITPCTSSD